MVSDERTSQQWCVHVEGVVEGNVDEALLQMTMFRCDRRYFQWCIVYKVRRAQSGRFLDVEELVQQVVIVTKENVQELMSKQLVRRNW